ncbi:prepilin-type N-terminal cleavage/methylation domain-containing protein [Candidatus Saccharibacteria bacterium]|nr:prepilin-type N-terminal cleavage/methylation domain-containing protein [Candidatus Saccharibacteria bacterium]
MRQDKGFTIVELMISTVVFSMVLLLCSYAIIHVGKMYYKGVLTAKTQDAARRVVDSVANSFIMNSGATVWTDTKAKKRNGGGREYEERTLCVGNDRFNYAMNIRLGTDSENEALFVFGKTGVSSRLYNECVIYVSDGGGFPYGIADYALGGSEMLSVGMRLVDLTFDSTADGLRTVKATVAYGEDSDFVDNDPNKGCKALLIGGQFCAVSSYSTVVDARLR